MICLPFYVGILLSLFIFSVSGVYLGVGSVYLAAFLDGCFASGGVWLIHSLQEKLER